MQVGFYFDQTRCTGCFACAVACKDWHDIPAGPVRWRTVRSIEAGAYPNPFLAYLSESCYHCERPGCVDACPAQAITKRAEDGIVVVDAEACLGPSICGGPCRSVCSYGAPQLPEGDGEKMQKCDLCVERIEAGKKPVCVESCPLRALDAAPMEELRQLYGDSRSATGFTFSDGMQPAAVFKGKEQG